MRCTILSRSTPIDVTRSRMGIGSTLDASCARKEWIPWHERFSNERAAPSLQRFGSEPWWLRRVWPGLLWYPEPPPPTKVDAGNWVNHVRQAKSGGQWHNRVHQDYAWVKHWFCELSRGERTKVETLKWRLKALLPCFRLSSSFWFTNFPLFWFLTVWPCYVRREPK